MRGDATCRKVTEALSTTSGSSVPDGPLREHLDRCLRCQVSAVRFRRLERELGELGSRRYVPPPDLLPETLRMLRDGDELRSDRHLPRVAEVAAWAAAATGAAAGAVVIGRRLRQHATA